MRSSALVVVVGLAAFSRGEDDGRAIGLAHAMRLFQSWYRSADSSSREKVVNQLSQPRSERASSVALAEAMKEEPAIISPAATSASASKAPVCGAASDRLNCMPPEEGGPRLSIDERGHLLVSPERSSYTLHTHCCGRGGTCWMPIHKDNRKVVLFESKHLEHRVGRAAWRERAPAGSSAGRCSAGVVNLTRDSTPYPFWDLRTCLALSRKILTGAPLCEDRRRDPTGKTLIQCAAAPSRPHAVTEVT